jgi:DNA-binding MarR family transcriptional regulator
MMTDADRPKDDASEATEATMFLEVSQLCACLNLRRAARAVTQRYDEAFRPAGLRATQVSILVSLAGRGPLTVNGLAEAVMSDPTTVTRNLKPLEKRGLLRTRHGEDRRERVVELTARGRKALGRIVPLWERVQSGLVKGLGKERLVRLLGDLEAAVAVTRGS